MINMKYDKCAFHILDFSKDSHNMMRVIRDDVKDYGACIIRSVASKEHRTMASRYCNSIIIRGDHIEFDLINVALKQVQKLSFKQIHYGEAFFSGDTNKTYKTPHYLTIDQLLDLVQQSNILATTALMNLELLSRPESDFEYDERLK